MSRPAAYTAQLLETSASAYAGFATSLLLERHPELAERYAPMAMRTWKSSLTQRTLELAAALDAAEPRLFTSRIRWAEQAFQARQLEPRDLYSSLVCLREVLHEELPEAGREEATTYLDQALDSLNGPAAEPRAELDPSHPHQRLALQYMQAVLEGDSRRGIATVSDAVAEGLSVRDAYLEVLLAAQKEIGGLWHLGQVSVAEEHFVTATTERAMAVLAQGAERRPDNGRTVLSAAVAGNTHGLAVRVLADFFELDGWRSIYAGADLPTDDLATAAVYFEADLLVLSAALPTQLKSTRQIIRAVRGLPERDVKILVGGVAFADAPELWKSLGADGYAPDADGAVELGRQLLGLA